MSGSEFGGLLWRHLTTSEKNRNMGAQLQYLMCTTARKKFWKLYFLLYDFWCAQSCSFRAILDYLLEVCGSSISATRPYPYRMMLTRTRTRLVPKIATRPDPTRGYTRTRSLPVGLPLPGTIGRLGVR